MAWQRYDDRDVPLQDRAQKAIQRHTERFGVMPNVLRVWRDCPDIIGLQGITVEKLKRIQPNIFETDSVEK